MRGVHSKRRRFAATVRAGVSPPNTSLSPDHPRRDVRRLEREGEEAATREIPQSPSRRVIEERRTPTAVYRLELVNYGKERCRKCGKGPSHGPYWYAYWWQGRKTCSRYIGKELTGSGL